MRISSTLRTCLTITQLSGIGAIKLSSVAWHIPEWKMLVEGRITSAELRQNYVHSHGVILHALGLAGNALISLYPDEWKYYLRKLEEIDWSKSNPKWEGRAMQGGRLSKAYVNVILAANYIKQVLGLPLSKEEQKIEEGHLKGKLSEVFAR